MVVIMHSHNIPDWTCTFPDNNRPISCTIDNGRRMIASRTAINHHIHEMFIPFMNGIWICDVIDDIVFVMDGV